MYIYISVNIGIYRFQVVGLRAELEMSRKVHVDLKAQVDMKSPQIVGLFCAYDRSLVTRLVYAGSGPESTSRYAQASVGGF